MGALDQEPIDSEPRSAEGKAHLMAQLAHYRDLLLKRWWILGGGLILGLLIALVVWWYEPRMFVSTGRMIVSIKLAIPEGSVYSEELGNFLGTQTALMRSGVVQNRAQARLLSRDMGPGLQPMALNVAVSPKTSIFVLETVGADPHGVQFFLQACMEEYIKLKKEMRAQTSDATVAGLTEEVIRLERDLRSCGDDLVRFQRSNSLVLLPEQGNGVGAYVAALTQRLGALKAEEALLQSLSPGHQLDTRPALDANSAEPAAPGSSSSSDRQDSGVLKARQQIQVLKAEQKDLSGYLRPKHPRMVALSEDIARRETLLAIVLEQDEAELANRRSSLASQVQYLERDLADQKTKALECSQKFAEYDRLKANQQRVQTLYDRLLATLQTLDLNKEISPESVTILEAASPPIPDERNSFHHFLTAGLVAIVMSLALVLFIDRIDDRIKSFTDLRDWFQEPVLVQVPRQPPIRKGSEVGLLAQNDPRHAFVEAFRSLRSSLLFHSPEVQKPHTLLLTSSVPGEGKSLISANLAITLASANTRVLLVDADLRKGVLHERFGLAASTGLSEVLASQASWRDAILNTQFPGLFLLPRGTPTSASGELFLAEGTHGFLSEAAGNYDFVILDAAPVMAADDVTSLAPRVDGTLFVLRAEHTSARVARAALELLYRRQVNVLGVVFNAVQPRSADYYAYGRYDHYCAPAPRPVKGTQGNA